MSDKDKKSKKKKSVDSPVPAKKQVKGRNKAIYIIISVLLLLGVVGGIIYYFSVRQSPENIVMSAVIKSIESDDIKASGTMSTILDQVDGKLNVDFSSAKANKDGSLDAKVTYESATTEDKVTVEGKAILGADGTAYIKVDNVSGVIETLYKEMGSMYDRVQVQGSEAQPFKVNSLIVGMGEFLDDKWIKFPVDQNTNDESTMNPLACMQGVVAKYNANSSERDAIIKAYKNNDFLEIDTETLDDKDSSDGYRVSVDADRFKTFSKELEKTTVGKMLADCADDSSSVSDSVDESTSEFVDLWINKYSHDITHAKLGTDDGMKLDVEFKYGDGAKVTIPEDAKTIMDIFSKSNLEAEAKKQ